MNKKLAKALRILTLPPVLVLVLILLLRSQYPPLHAAIAVLTLAVFPLLAYLVWSCVPTLHRQGRPAQRSLAVVFSVIGYVVGLLCCALGHGSATEWFVYLCYVISGILIALSPRCFHVKSSGHACGVVGPVVILALLKSPWFLLGLVLLLPVWVSSLGLGRHTKQELLLGGLYPAVTAVMLYYVFF